MAVVVSQLVAEVSVRGADQAQASLKDVGTATTTLQEKLNTIKPYNAGESVSGVDVAQAKLTLLEDKVTQARDKLQTLQDSADAGNAVKGIPEAEANLVLLQDKAQQARANLEELKTAAVDTGEGMATLEQGTQAAEESVSNFTPAVKEAKEATGGGFLSAIKETAGGFVDFVGKVGMGIMSAQMVWGTVKNVTAGLIKAAQDNQAAQAQTAQAIKSTGDASGMTVASISNLADSLSQVTDFSKDTVQGGENLLLTFTGIGKQVFPDTTKTMLDMAQAMHEGPTQAAMMLGKALNDPTTGLSALTRVGVTFSDQEKKQIQTMMAHNDVVGAQKVMLKELSTEFGGSAEAAGKTFGGALDILKNRLDDVKQKIGTAVLPVLTNFVTWLSSPAVASFADTLEKDVVSAFSHVGQGVKYVGEVLHSLNLSDFKEAWHTVSFEVEYASGKFKEFTSHLTAAKGDFDPIADAIAGIAKAGLKGVTDLLWGFSQAFMNVDKAVQDGSGPFAGFVNQAKQVGGSLLSISPGVTLIQVLIKHSQELAQWWQTSVIPAFKQAEPGFKNLGQALAGLLPVIEHIASVVHDVLQHAFEAMLPVFEKAVPIIIKIAGILSDGLGSAIKFLSPYISQATDAIGKFAKEIIDRVAPIVSQWLDNLNTNINNFMVVWKTVWPFLAPLLKGVWDEIVGIVKIAWALVSGIIKIGLDLFSGNWKKAWDDTKDMLAGVWDGIKTYLKGVWEIIKSIFVPVGAFFGGIWKNIQDAFGNIGKWFSDHFTEGKNNATAPFNSIGAFFSGVWKNIQDAFSGIGKWFSDRWNETITPLKPIINFISAVFQTINNIILAIVGKVVGWLAARWNEISETVRVYWTMVQTYIAYYLGLINQKIQEIVGAVKKWLTDRWNDIKTDVSNVWGWISSHISQVWGNIYGTIQQKVSDAWNFLKGIWNNIKADVSGVWDWISSHISDVWKNINDTIQSKIATLKDNIMAPFNSARDAIGGVLKAFANNMVDALNNGVSAVENFINFFGQGLDNVATALGTQGTIPVAHLGRIPHYAAGTPGSGHPEDGPAVVGERGRELVFLPKGATVVPNGPTEKVLSATGAKVPAYADGIGDIAGNIWNWVSGGAKSIIDNVIKSLNLNLSLPGSLSNIASGAFDSVKNWAVNWVQGILPHFSFGGSPVNAPGNVQSWISAAMALTGVPSNWAGALATIAMHESGGDPNAQNNSDINAQNGDPSRGLFQTIGATFAAYMVPGHSNILDPISNAAAAVNYIKARYGTVFNVPGIVSMAQGGPYIGYAGGTSFNPADGTYVVGERGPELVHLPRGASVTPNDQIGSSISNREILARLDRIATLLENGMSLDGQRVSRVLMPSLIQEVRDRTSARF